MAAGLLLVIKIALLFIFLILVGNVVFLDYVFVNQKNQVSDLAAKVDSLTTTINAQQITTMPSGNSFNSTVSAVTVNNACPQSCVTVINSAIANVKPISGGTTVVNKNTTVSSKGEYLISLGAGSVDQIGTWVDAYTAQAIVDTSAYSNIKAIYFEAVMHIPNASGQMQAKLIDDTTPFSYDGQVLSTTSGTGQLLSVAVPLVSGKKTYHVRLYTTISSGVLDSARIRIVTQ